MAHKVYLSPSDQTRNQYAYGNTTEDKECGKIAQAAKKALERCGISVKLGQYDTMANRCKESDAFGAELHVPIHTNACNGKVGGTRIFYSSKTSKGYKACEKMLVVLGPMSPGTSDSISAQPQLFEVKTPAAPTCYIEFEFHDVKEYAKWIIEHTTEIGEGIAKGICDYFGISYVAPNSETSTSNSSSGKIYRVQVGAYSNQENAKAMQKKLQNLGFEAIIV